MTLVWKCYSKRFQPWEGPSSWGLLRDCQNWLIVCSTTLESHYNYDIRRDEEDTDSDTGDNFMTMLLKPSYTAQESMKSEAEEKVEDTELNLS